MKKYAVIVAAGAGSRMNAGVPKQFLLLHGKPVLVHSVEAFFKAFDDVVVILVLPQSFMPKGAELVGQYFPGKNIILTAGGETRFASVKNGLHHVTQDSIVFVHDAVRCLVTPELIARCYKVAVDKGTAIPVVAAKDSLRMVTAAGNSAIERNSVKVVQTPQVFRSQILLPAFQQHYQPFFTDEATVVEHSGVPVHLVEGEETNLKITHPSDLIIAGHITVSAT